MTAFVYLLSLILFFDVLLLLSICFCSIRQDLLSSLARLNYKKGIATSIASSCLLRAKKDGDGASSPSRLADMVWACGRLGLRDDALLKPVLQMLIRSPQTKMPVR